MMKTLISVVVLLAGCAELPTVKQCSDVTYVRKGMDYEISLKGCRIPAETPLGGLVQQALPLK
jgi:hypothetical protein